MLLLVCHVMSYLILIYSSTDIKPQDPHWVGAWWICYTILVSVISCLVISYPILSYLIPALISCLRIPTGLEHGGSVMLLLVCFVLPYTILSDIVPVLTLHLRILVGLEHGGSVMLLPVSLPSPFPFSWRVSHENYQVGRPSVRRQKGLTGYSFKYIDRPFCLQTDDIGGENNYYNRSDGIHDNILHHGLL